MRWTLYKKGTRKLVWCFAYFIHVHSDGFQHKSVPFKVAELYRWVVVLSSREHMEELRTAPDDTLSSGSLKGCEVTIFFWVGWQRVLMSPTANSWRAHDESRNSP